MNFGTETGVVPTTTPASATPATATPAPTAPVRAPRAVESADKAPARAKSEAPSRDAAVKAAAERLEAYMKSNGRTLEFQVDKGSGRTVVRVRDLETGDLIRQIPGDEVLKLARMLDAGQTSALVSLTA